MALKSQTKAKKKYKKINSRVNHFGVWKGEKRGIYDRRNTLNDLTGKEWLPLTKSFWFSEKCAEDKFAFQHPAPFLINDIRKLIKLFTKKRGRVLDPFNGTGTTLVAAYLEKRKGVGIDLSKKYCQLAKRRLKQLGVKRGQRIIHGNSIKKLPKIKGLFDYCVTSPPYHNILRNNGNGLRHDNSQKRQGVEYYSESRVDLGNQKTYKNYLNLLSMVMREVYKKLKKSKYCSIIISDFTVNKKEANAHGDIINLMKDLGFGFCGTVILIQNSKPLYPFGYPFSLVLNHSHQYILHFKKIIIYPEIEKNLINRPKTPPKTR